MKGTFVGRAQAWDLRVAKTGTEQILIKFAIEEGQHAGETVYWTGSFTDKSFDFTMESLRTCGFEGDDLSNLESLSNNQVQLVIDEEEYDDKTYSRVQFINKIGSMAIKGAMSDAEKAEFAARMRGRVLASKSEEPEKTAEQVVNDMDDIPF